VTLKAGSNIPPGCFLNTGAKEESGDCRYGGWEMLRGHLTVWVIGWRYPHA